MARRFLRISSVCPDRSRAIAGICFTEIMMGSVTATSDAMQITTAIRPGSHVAGGRRIPVAFSTSFPATRLQAESRHDADQGGGQCRAEIGARQPFEGLAVWLAEAS